MFDDAEGILEEFNSTQTAWSPQVHRSMIYGQDPGVRVVTPMTDDELAEQRARWKARYEADPDYRARVQAYARTYWSEHPEVRESARRRARERYRQDPAYRDAIRRRARDRAAARRRRIARVQRQLLLF